MLVASGLQQWKQRKNGGCRACYYSHSIVGVLQTLIAQGFERHFNKVCCECVVNRNLFI